MPCQAITSRADLGVVPGGPGAPFVRDFFFVSKRVSDGISNWLLKYIFSLINIVNN